MKVGDRVRLKSGGPVMTVAAVLRGGRVRCVWFALSDPDARGGVFPASGLKMVDPPAPTSKRSRSRDLS